MAQQVWRPLLWEAGLFHSVPMGQSDEDRIINLSISNCDMLAVSECQHCEGISIWLNEQMLYPDGYAPPPNADLSDEIKRDYTEARSIVNKSPRGAAALLRLCIEKLCDQIGAQGDNINKQIGYLVKERHLNPVIQKSLDLVRVIGNEAVHPGTIDLGDDKKTALGLFTLINLIATAMITEPKEVDEMYRELPESKVKGIEERDRRK